jgi:signal transduction histidine kinase/ActR/RegA family two-component response regulator
VNQDEEWINFLDMLAGQAAIAIDNAQLFSASQQELAERRLIEAELRRSHLELEKRIEERTSDLRNVNFELQRALRVKDEFLANMSHELRTPLNAVIGLSESLSEQAVGPLNDKQDKYVNIIRESGQHLLDLINDILDLAKIEAGQISLVRDKMDIATVSRSSLRMIKQLALKKNQEVLFEMDPDLGMIYADERRVKQMLVNLLSNAVKFTPENGRIGMNVSGDRNTNVVAFTVWDTGIGIHENDLERLFKPFVQLDADLDRRAGGTGLGLALVAKMADMHGGSISVESTPGEGSRFTINLPWESALLIGASAEPAFGKDQTADLDGKNQDHTILLVEDNEDIILLVKDYLEYVGHKVVVALNGMEGVIQAEAIKPSLILMDVQMPVLNGLDATRRIRKIPALMTTPIFALTALAMKGDRERCLEAGMTEYISTPLNLKSLAGLIQSYLGSGSENP